MLKRRLPRSMVGKCSSRGLVEHQFPYAFVWYLAKCEDMQNFEYWFCQVFLLVKKLVFNKMEAGKSSEKCVQFAIFWKIHISTRQESVLYCKHLYNNHFYLK